MSEAQAMREAAKIARDRIATLIADLQGELEVMQLKAAFPGGWSLDVKVADLLAILPPPQPDPNVEAMAAASIVMRNALLSATEILENAPFESPAGWFIQKVERTVKEARAALANYRASREQGGRT